MFQVPLKKNKAQMGLTILVKDSTFKMKLKENATMVELSPPQ